MFLIGHLFVILGIGSLILAGSGVALVPVASAVFGGPNMKHGDLPFNEYLRDLLRSTDLRVLSPVRFPGHCGRRMERQKGLCRAPE